MTQTDDRNHQRFPTFSAAQIATAKRFAVGDARRFEPGETVFEIGQAHASAWLVLSGQIDIVRRDGLGHEAALTSHVAGQMSGEISQLSGGTSLAEGKAGPDGCTALPFDAAHLRALIVGSAELGEILMRAFILRRVALIEDGGAGSVLVGRDNSADLVRLQGFLSRNGYPYTTLDADDDADGRALVERLGIAKDDLPLMVCPNGTVLKRPTDAEAAVCLGITPELDPAKVYDVAVVGAGPAGLAAAVYGASEGLSVIVLDSRAMGGQAGASARIENYLGFPTGISGQALAGRAFTQALKFGAEIAIPLEVDRLECAAENEELTIHLTDGQLIRARTVVAASGVRYRRPDIANLGEFEGRGVSYWASPIEAKLCEGEDVSLIGGGNSAGQAVAFLAPKVNKLHLIIRGHDLQSSMSRYLIDRIEALPNVELHARTEIVGLEGDDDGLTGSIFRSVDTGETSHCASHHLFLFIGADPNAGWLQACAETDAKGFTLTGDDIEDGKRRAGLETSVPGLFAIGDVRAGSTKRVAAAVGEGAQVVAQIHAALAARDSGGWSAGDCDHQSRIRQGRRIWES